MAFFAGALLAFTMSFDDFVISYFVSGNGVKNISIVVYNMTKRINPTINALSTIVILVIVLVMVFANVLPKLLEKHASKHAKKIQRVIALLLGFCPWLRTDQVRRQCSGEPCPEGL